MNKILIIRLSSLGDVVLTQPVVEVLKDNYPHISIDYLTKPAYIEVVKAFGDIDHIYLWKDKKKVIHQLNKNRYDFIIDLHDKTNTFFIKRFVRAGRKITYRKLHWRRWLITKKIIKSSNPLMVNLYLAVLKKVGLVKKDIFPHLQVDDAHHSKIERVLREIGINKDHRVIGIFPGTLHQTKQYPVEKFVDFVNMVPLEWNCKFLALGSSAEKKLCCELARKTNSKVIDLGGAFTLGELIYLISSLNAVISGDSGPMHITAALKIPQIAIFGATHPRLGFPPLNQAALICSTEIKCQPCSLHGQEKCPLKHFNCMNKLSPVLIKDFLREILFQ